MLRWLRTLSLLELFKDAQSAKRACGHTALLSRRFFCCTVRGARCKLVLPRRPISPPPKVKRLVVATVFIRRQVLPGMPRLASPGPYAVSVFFRYRNKLVVSRPSFRSWCLLTLQAASTPSLCRRKRHADLRGTQQRLTSQPSVPVEQSVELSAGPSKDAQAVTVL